MDDSEYVRNSLTNIYSKLQHIDAILSSFNAQYVPPSPPPKKDGYVTVANGHTVVAEDSLHLLTYQLLLSVNEKLSSLPEMLSLLRSISGELIYLISGFKEDE